MEEFDCASAILSIIKMDKFNCITMEQYEEMYKTNEDSERRKDLSVGEDLETFIANIKNGEINRCHRRCEDFNITFLLCLLDKEEREKLERKDADFMKTFFDHSYGGLKEVPIDVPEAEWKASESNMKFARSRCLRKTYFIDA